MVPEPAELQLIFPLPSVVKVCPLLPALPFILSLADLRSKVPSLRIVIDSVNEIDESAAAVPAVKNSKSPTWF